MSMHIAGHVPLAGHEKVVHGWKLWIAGAAIAALIFVGFYLAISQWQRDREYALMLFGDFVGPAIAAAFGYFWCLPEVLGGNLSRPRENAVTKMVGLRAALFLYRDPLGRRLVSEGHLGELRIHLHGSRYRYSNLVTLDSGRVRLRQQKNT
jgi:hypothetical protein